MPHAEKVIYGKHSLIFDFSPCPKIVFLFSSFGSKLRSRELGFIYNNELADFSEFWPTIYNLTSDKKEPRKRPMSKVMPGIFIKNKEVHGVWGAAGGFFIPSAITMVCSAFLYSKRYYDGM